MVILTKEFQSDTSVSSEVDDVSFEEKRIQIFAKQMLQGRLFIGSFQEKRYVDTIAAYRDVVSLTRDENDLIQDMLTVKQRVEALCTDDQWIGITTPETIGAPAFYSIWVELPEATVFGTYWFKIKRIKFSTKEISLRIKLLRSVTHDMHRETTEKENMKHESTTTNDIFDSIKQDAKENLLYVLKNVTFSNFKDTVVFLCMLVATVIVSLFELLKYTSEFLLRFMNEFSNFMKSVAPIFLILANLVDRMFRTLCMLIAFIFKKQPQNPYTVPSYKVYRNVPALPASSRRRGVIIEEVE